jgi:hypothetical protein
MAKPSTVLCSTCDYWDAITQLGDIGKCRRNAPASGATQSQMTTNHVYWPVTQGIDWCGEHQAFVALRAGRETLPAVIEPVKKKRTARSKAKSSPPVKRLSYQK